MSYERPRRTSRHHQRTSNRDWYVGSDRVSCLLHGEATMKSRVCGRCRKVVSGQCDCKKQRHSTTCKDGYGRKWQRFREQLFKKRSRTEGVVCAMCGLAFGGESPHGDHIIPVTSADDPLFFDEDNIQFLHPGCHGEKTKSDVKRGLTR